jgi:hypothetical protein
VEHHLSTPVIDELSLGYMWFAFPSAKNNAAAKKQVIIRTNLSRPLQ